MDMGDLRGVATILCMIGFLSVVVWAYAPSRRDYFERAAKLPFAESRGGEKADE